MVLVLFMASYLLQASEAVKSLLKSLCLDTSDVKAKETMLQWGKKVFRQPPIVQVLPLKNMREACHFHHRYTSNLSEF